MKLELTKEQVIQILNTLGAQPYAQVAQLIQLISEQFKAQEGK